MASRCGRNSCSKDRNSSRSRASASRPNGLGLRQTQMHRARLGVRWRSIRGDAKMEHIKFGPTDLMVSPIGLGCMSMSGCYGAQDDAECIATIHRALELGINFLDTSSNYGEGHNHTLIGKAIAGRRDEVVIHSKLGSIRPDGVNVVSGTPEHVRNSCEAGLKRLGIETMDVICISRVDPVVPIEDTVGAMAELVAEGKTRFIALSKGLTPELLARAMAVHPVVSVQDEYSLF
ncbi:MAG: aldo/keto reductase, partial [Alphaproteobacteria bacterium]